MPRERDSIKEKKYVTRRSDIDFGNASLPKVLARALFGGVVGFPRGGITLEDAASDPDALGCALAENARRRRTQSR